MTTVNEEGKALVEQSTFDKSKALADFMEYIHTYLTDDECDQVLKAFELADDRRVKAFHYFFNLIHADTPF